LVSAPPNIQNPIYMSSAEYHSCALNDAGEVACWRDDGDAPEEATQVPENLKARALCGMTYNCAIDDEQAVLCWGPGAPQPPPALRAQAIACGGNEGYGQGPSHACAIDLDSQVVCWGDGDGGATDVPAGLTARTIAAGLRRTCAVDLEDNLVCWGETHATPPPNTAQWVFMHMMHGATISLDGTLQIFGRVPTLHVEPPVNFKVAPSDSR
jgi:hypothetical protein